jgi:serine kinase of HPr protein (carbohydrate metabolism regulator)
MKKELAEIKDKLTLLKRLDKRFQVVGANEHRYYNYAPDKSEVEEFEAIYQVKLPKPYRDF